MGWQDSDHQDDQWRRMGRPGGDWQGIRPSFDNPMSWALPLFRISGISVKLHIIFILLVVIMLLRSLAAPGEDETISLLDFRHMALGVGFLFLLVLLHEFGHCIACRWAGGAADEILMWPLGGLAYCRPPSRWKSHLVTAVGGPAVNVVFCVVSGVMLGLLTGKWLGVALPNPLSPYPALLELNGSWVLTSLYMINWISLVLLLFNLLPLFPMDGGRILQAGLWARFGYVPSMRIAVRVGYIGAIGLGLWGAVVGNWFMLGIAVFGGLTCYMTHRQLEFTEQVMGEAAYAYPSGSYEGDDDRPTRRQRLAERRAEKEARLEKEEAEAVDQILEQISRQGMESLSAQQKRLLKRNSERRRD